MEDLRWMIDQLPESAPKTLLGWALRQGEEELGGEFTVFHRETPREDVQWELLPCPPRKRGWVAACTCTACYEDFETLWGGKRSNGSYFLRAIEGEDGTVYNCVDDPDGVLSEFEEGDALYCPYCGSRTTLIHKSRLKGGRIYATQAGTVERIGAYTVLLYWLIRRRLNEDGYFTATIRPREAVALDKDGRLWRFSHSQYSDVGERDGEKWEHRTFRDPEQIKFYSYGDGSRRTTVGCWWRKMELPELTGSSGEKTGLLEYLRSESAAFPAVYLGTWKQHPQLENLAKAGLGRLLAQSIGREVESQLNYHSHARSVRLDFVDWDEVKPHRMLHMSREELRQSIAFRWGEKEYTLWREIGRFRTAPDMAQLQDWLRRYGLPSVEQVFRMEQDGQEGCRMERVFAYLDRQENIPMGNRALMFRDYRRMLGVVLGEERPDRIQLWPPQLRAAHDRMQTQVKVEEDARLLARFRELKRDYAPLEWTDGVYRIVVPESGGELAREGKTLHHCVGGYGKTHTEGKPIFFVRKYRRPERSYFTLNENLTGEAPQRIQLHGYGNEYAHGKPLKIPRAVLDFVQRWEQEVLRPWFLEQRRQAYKQENKNRQENRKGRKTA